MVLGPGGPAMARGVFGAGSGFRGGWRGAGGWRVGFWCWGLGYYSVEFRHFPDIS